MVFLRKYGFTILIIAVLSELFVPFLLSQFYPNYNQLTMLLSDFGREDSPVQIYFKIWQFIDGLLFLASIPSFFYRFKPTSFHCAKWLSLSLTLFAIGDCILTSLFDRTITSEFSLQGAIHEYGSGIGFVAFLVGTFLLIKLYLLEKDKNMVISLIIIFILSSLFMLLFSSPNFPLLNTLDIPYRGLWQRLNLLFLYLPFLITAIKNRNYQKK